jgi:hypothetical protein
MYVLEFVINEQGKTNLFYIMHTSVNRLMFNYVQVNQMAPNPPYLSYVHFLSI